MKVFKFGGASVKNPEGVRNLKAIIENYDDNLVVVVSAFGKTTNGLEGVLRSWYSGDSIYLSMLQQLYDLHSGFIGELSIRDKNVSDKFEVSFSTLREFLSGNKPGDYDSDYDQVVTYGEVWSTIIVSGYLNSEGLNVKWIDARENLMTDDRYRDANILWGETEKRFRAAVNFEKGKIYITQGFIGGTVSGKVTSLGREGSDYTAAIIANVLNATEVIVWKDVPGILNADPDWMPDADRIEALSYKEAVEMFFSGAKVVHPKTIKPLHNKSIPLYVRSFVSPQKGGTIISANEGNLNKLPLFVRKENQVLLSLVPADFSFVMGENLGKVFHLFYKHGIKTNLVQASAVSIAVCVDDDPGRVEKLTDELKTDFSIRYNSNVELVTVRHYNEKAIERATGGKSILLEQRTRKSIRYVLKSE